MLWHLYNILFWKIVTAGKVQIDRQIDRQTLLAGNTNTGNTNTRTTNTGNINTGNTNTGNINTGTTNTGNTNTGNTKMQEI